MSATTTTGERAGCRSARPRLAAHARAQLPRDAATRVAAHLECCRGCSAAYVALLAPAARPVRSGAGVRVLRRVTIGVAVAALVVGAALLLRTGGPGRPGDDVVAAPPPAGPGRTAARPRFAAPPSTAAPAVALAPSVTAEPQPTGPPTSEPAVWVPPAAPTATPSLALDPAEVDVALSASRRSLGPGSVVTVRVSGLGPRQPGVVTLSADHLAATLALDPRCTLVGAGTASCAVVGAATLELLAAAPLRSTTLTISAAPGPGLRDPAPADNTARVALD